MTLQLENYGVSELPHSEQRETDGGFWPFLALGLLLLSGCQSGNGNVQQESVGSNNKNTANTKADSSSTTTTTSPTTTVQAK